jgi:hypothetical protein
VRKEEGEKGERVRERRGGRAQIWGMSICSPCLRQRNNFAREFVA